MSSLGPRAGGLRLIRIVLVCVAIGVMTNSAANVLLWNSNGARVDQINEERARAVMRSCELANRQNAAIVGFIEQNIPARRRDDPVIVRYLADARKTFPQVDCRALVRRQVSAK